MTSALEAWLPKSILLLRGYDRHKFLSDLIAGVTVGLVALPLAMAFAIASGVSPQAGLYCAIVTGFLISALGGSKTQIGGPTGAFVVVVAGIIDIVAGLTLEKRFSSFLVFPALLVLVPPFLEDSGALGAILSARVSTKLHLGTLEPSRSPFRAISEDMLLVYVYAVPVFFFLGVSADIAAAIAGLRSPGVPEMIGVAMLAGFFATTCATLIGYYGALASYRLGFDPDNHGIPVVTSSLDLLGAVCLILAIVVLGLT